MGLLTPCGRDCRQRLHQLPAIVIDLGERDTLCQIGESPHHQMPVLNHIRDARRDTRIVFKDQKFALFITHQIGAADMHIGSLWRDKAFHFRAIMLVVLDQLLGNDPIPEHLAVVVYILKEEVQCRNPLLDSRVDLFPILRRKHPGDNIERQDTINRIAVGMNP